MEIAVLLIKNFNSILFRPRGKQLLLDTLVVVYFNMFFKSHTLRNNKMAFKL